MQAQTQSSNSKARVAVVGARGYSGVELLKILATHPSVELKGVFATETFNLQSLGISGIDRNLKGQGLAELQKALEIESASFEIVFLATPAEVSLEWAPKLIKSGARVIDLSGAFRLKGKTPEDSIKQYKTWYGLTHTELELLQEAEYGLIPFVNPKSEARLIANPGCYATIVSLMMAPLLAKNLVAPKSVVVDAKSGTTGAGKKLDERFLFSEQFGNFAAYKALAHQHEPEIRQAVANVSSKNLYDFDFAFTPHLLPVARGIQVSLYAELTATEAEVQSAYSEFYIATSTIEIETASTLKSELDFNLASVTQSPMARIAFKVQKARAPGLKDRIVVFGLIDNLLKGAASQAIENMNRFLGVAIDTGLQLRTWKGE